VRGKALSVKPQSDYVLAALPTLIRCWYVCVCDHRRAWSTQTIVPRAKSPLTRCIPAREVCFGWILTPYPCRRLGLLGSVMPLSCCRWDESHSPLATKRSLTLLATPVVSGDVAAADAVVPTDYLAFPLLSPQTTWLSPCCLRLASSLTRYAHAGLGKGVPCAGRPHTSVLVCRPSAGTVGS
jgi:hypothetical protein